MRSRFAPVLFAVATLVLVAGGRLRAAPPGYVDDGACAECHRAIFADYQQLGMARSFFRPRAERVVEDFENNQFFHRPSGLHHALRQEGERFIYERWRLDASGRRTHHVEQQVDWVLGSGNHSRTYLFRAPSGELYQLPIAWYSPTAAGEPGQWHMAPGFDHALAGQEGFGRRVRRECMFCHNAYPDFEPGSDLHGEPQIYPEELPEGTGCQRCHGPGAEHVRLASSLAPISRLEAAIVNPAKLPSDRRDDVCEQCHLQPSVALSGVRHFGRGDYSFRPGEDLDDYLVQVDVEQEGVEGGERFEINHHPYRLRQSACFQKSAGRLSCLTCHDPHRKVAGSERAAHYRAACLSCHVALEHPSSLELAAADCAACHMPKRRPQDVVRVVMTDHLIRRQPGGPELLAPRQEMVPVLLDVRLLRPHEAPRGDLGEVYRAVAVLRAGGGDAGAAADHLERALRRAQPAELAPYLDLARGLVSQQRWDAAESLLRAILERQPAHPQARLWWGLTANGLGRPEEGVAVLRQLVEDEPRRAEAHFNLALLLYETSRLPEALAALRKARELRPNMTPAWLWAGRIETQLGRPRAAASAYRRALSLEPSHSRAVGELERLLTGAESAGE